MGTEVLKSHGSKGGSDRPEVGKNRKLPNNHDNHWQQNSENSC